MITVNSRQLAEHLITCFEAQRVPMVYGPPGVGKSQIAAQVAKQLNLELLDVRLGTKEVIDMSGFAVRSGDVATYIPFDFFPIEKTPLPKGKDGWMILLDELPQASRAVKNAAFQLILDRMVGMHKLHSNVVIMAAGNRLKDNADAGSINTALQSRMVHLELEVNFDIWVQDVALKQGYDHRIVAYLNQFPEKLMDFDPQHKNYTYPCPRTWEMANDFAKGQPLDLPRIQLLSGCLSDGAATDFVGFCSIFNLLTPRDAILANPHGAPIPQERPALWATMTSLTNGLTKKEFPQAMIYADRMPIEMKVLFLRTCLIAKVADVMDPIFRKAQIDLARYLM